MTEATSATAQKDGIHFGHMLAYGSGAFANNLLAGTIGAMAIVFNLGYGMDPGLAGLILGLLPRLFDAITDPLMGYISDNTKSRWGRRRPFIFIGAILVGIAFALIWQAPQGQSESFYFVWFLVGLLIFYVCYTIFATPWVALGYELTPDYNKRSFLMGTQNFIGQLAYFVPPWLILAMSYTPIFPDLRSGAAGIAIVIGMVVALIGVLPAIFLRERMRIIAMAEINLENQQKGDHAATIGSNIRAFFKSFGDALSFIPFLRLCGATFLVFNGFILIAAFQSYVIIYYLFGGDTGAAGLYIGYVGTATTAATFLAIIVVTWLATIVGKRGAFVIAIGISIVGYLAKWVCYNPDMPWMIVLPAPLLAFGLGGLFTLMPSMMADIVDRDELKTHQRREGMYGSIYWWVVKLGMAVALAAGGYLLNATGFDVALEGNQTETTLLLLRVFDVFIPAVASALAIFLVVSLDLSKEKAAAVRAQLEERRGTPAAVPAE